MALTEETLQALAAMRAAVGRLVDGQASDIIAAWLHALQEVRAELDALAVSEVDRRRLLAESQRIVAERIHDVAQDTNARLTTQARLMAGNALAWQEALIETQLPPAGVSMVVRPARAAIDAIVTRTVQQITVRHYYLSRDATRAVQQNLRIGITAGLSPREAAARMIQAAEGAFNGGLTRALTIARTEMLDAHRAASHATRTANEDVLAGWVWIAKLDARTCPSCIAQHGRLHDADDPGPHDHHNGRCAALPKVRSWAELGVLGIDEPPGLDIQSGENWFARLPPARQQEILGPARYSAWRAGAYPIDAWSEKRVSEGWRDAWHTSPAPQEPEGGWKWPAPPPNRPLTPVEAEHFHARQMRVPFKWHGETLSPNEVEFVERMHARGEVLEWIPKPKVPAGMARPSSNDFIWHSKGIHACELKSTTPRYESVKGAVSKAIKKARKHNVVKENFVIDLGQRSLTDKLKRQLSTYNVRVKDTQVRSLWVLSDDGKHLTRVL